MNIGIQRIPDPVRKAPFHSASHIHLYGMLHALSNGSYPLLLPIHQETFSLFQTFRRIICRKS